MPDDAPATIRSVDDLTPDDANANKGSERGTAVVEKSLERNGAGRSILVDRNGVVIAGNKTLEGWVGLGADRVRVVQTDGHELVVVQRTDLDLSKGGKARRLAILDNRAGQVSLTWDAGVLLNQMQALEIEPDEIGFTADELVDLGAAAAEAAAAGEQPERAAREVACPECGFKFKPGAKE